MKILLKCPIGKEIILFTQPFKKDVHAIILQQRRQKYNREKMWYINKQWNISHKE